MMNNCIATTLLILSLPLFVFSQHTLQYDNIGRMVSNEMEEIASIEWNNNNKVARITRITTSKAPDLEFKYDVFGNHTQTNCEAS